MSFSGRHTTNACKAYEFFQTSVMTIVCLCFQFSFIFRCLVWGFFLVFWVWGFFVPRWKCHKVVLKFT